MRLGVHITVVATALALAAGAAARPQTTKPGEHVIFGVRITDSKIVVYPRNREVRGIVATFTVDNKGKKAHDFAFLGQKTGKILPGRSGVFTVILVRRGKFLYRSTLDRGSGFRGYFTVT